MVSAITTSNALMRSVVSSSTRSSPTASMSRTLPRPIVGKGSSLARIVVVVIGKDFHGRGGSKRDSSLRQRNELMLLRNSRKAAVFPVVFRRLDPLLAGGDEIPPDVPRPLQRVAAQKHHPRRLLRLHGDAVARPEDQQALALV